MILNFTKFEPSFATNIKKNKYINQTGLNFLGNKPDQNLISPELAKVFAIKQGFNPKLSVNLNNINPISFIGKSKSPFELRGVIEGYYGNPYSIQERDDLLKFMSKYKFNIYVYAPKNDPYHRELWDQPYPDKYMQKLVKNIKTAKDLGIDFCYAISPGGKKIKYNSDEDLNKVFEKLKCFHNKGIKSFALLFDDIPDQFANKEDRESYTSFAQAHADFANRLNKKLKEIDPSIKLTICPTYYAGIKPFNPYLKELGSTLNKDIDIFYTGPEVCSKTISKQDCLDFAQDAGRKPLIWDNYPVKDGDMAGEMHIKPITGRSKDLAEGVKGILINPMDLEECSKVPIATFADYMEHPDNYNSQKSFILALKELAGNKNIDDLEEIINNIDYSCLNNTPSRIANLTNKIVNGIEQGKTVSEIPEVKELDKKLYKIDEACDNVKENITNVKMLAEFWGWIENLKRTVQIGQCAIRVLEAMEKGKPYEISLEHMDRFVLELEKLHHKTSYIELMPLVELVRNRASVESSIVK